MGALFGRLTLSVHGEVDITNGAVGAKDLAEMVFVDVFGEFFNNDLDQKLISLVLTVDICVGDVPLSSLV